MIIADISLVVFGGLMLLVMGGYFLSLSLPEKTLVHLTHRKDKILQDVSSDNVHFLQVELFWIPFLFCFTLSFIFLHDFPYMIGMIIATVVVFILLACLPLKLSFRSPLFPPVAGFFSCIHQLLYRFSPAATFLYHQPLSDNRTSMTDTNFKEGDILKEIIHFGNELVRDIMSSRADMVDLDFRASFADVLQVASTNKYSRIPVYSGVKDNIVGILYIKDLLPYLDKPSNFHWQFLIRAHICVPETKKIDNLLHEFQSKKIHLAVVIDEYGGVSGLVTLEDIIEEIVGEIRDEFDDEKSPYIKLNRNTYLFDACISLQDFCKVYQIDNSYFSEWGEDTNTLARLIVEIVGDIPQKHQIVKYRQFAFEVLKVDERHISKVKAQRQ